MQSIKENTVPVKGQLNSNEYITFVNSENKGIRVLFTGNSITRHGIAPHLGWHKDCGMAASSIDKDYVHVLMNKVLNVDSDAAFCICQVGEWERNYKSIGDDISIFEAARDFNADVIIARFIENCGQDDFDEDVFEKEYIRFIDYLNPENKAQVILTTSFWPRIGDENIETVGKKLGYPVIYLGDLGDNKDMKAIGEYEHGGVACHPNDRGMAEIAERIFNEIKF